MTVIAKPIAPMPPDHLGKHHMKRCPFALSLLLCGALPAMALAQAPAASAPAAPAAATAPFIAGLKPYERPANAPHVADVPMPEAQVKADLRGVSEPFPGNVATIVATGHWFVPMRRPGMTGPYDIRGWHHAVPSTAPAASAAK